MKHWMLEVCNSCGASAHLQPSQFILIVNNCEQKGPGGAGAELG